MKKMIFALCLLSLSPMAFAKTAKMPKVISADEAIAAANDSEIATRLKDDSSDMINAKLIADASAPQAPAAPKAVAEVTSANQSESAMEITGAATSPALAATAPASAGDAKAETKPETKVESKTEVSKLPEDQIPVLSSGTAAKKSGSDNFGRLMITLGVFTAALIAATFGLKRWAKKKGTKGTNTKIKVLTQHALGPKKSLCIVQVAGESILIGVTDHNISMLKTLSLIDDEVPADVPNNFDSTLSDYEDHEMASQARVISKGKKAKDAEKEGEDFTMQGLSEIRDTVSTRLRNMKNF